ncbi:hypothetical protein, partial [Thermogutta sp.]|uniref:hypothetical protein n=1 Tax=Thermogutta sp. TaxID=1962930 RepID=UPI00321F826E
MSCDPRRGLSVHDLDFYMDVALGRRDASLAVVNGSVVNVFTREIHENASIIVAGDRIVRVDLDGERSSIGPS